MSSPFFSIIIPTRQRHETLPFAIKTVLEQKFDDYELIICDNCSSSETKEAVSKFNNDKIKYIRSDVPISMSENWELGISNANGKYLIVFGDDDGLVQNSLGVLKQVIDKTGCEVVRWERAYYSWSSIPVKSVANQLSFPLISETKYINGNKIIKKVINFKESYTVLPMFYNAAVSIDIVNRLKVLSGRVFSSISPDVYSGYAFAYLSGEYLSLGVPMTINGGSAKSNGVATFLPANDISSEFKMLTKSSDIKHSAKIPNVRSIAAAVMEPFLKLKETVHDIKIDVDMKLVMGRILDEVKVFDQEDLDCTINAILDSCKNDRKLYNFVKKRLLQNPIKISGASIIQPYKIGVVDNILTIDASKFGISDVFGVSLFVSNFFDFNDTTEFLDDEIELDFKRVRKILNESIVKIKRCLYDKK